MLLVFVCWGWPNKWPHSWWLKKTGIYSLTFLGIRSPKSSLSWATLFAETLEDNGNQLQYSCMENSMDREPGGLQSKGTHRVGHDWVTDTPPLPGPSSCWLFLACVASLRSVFISPSLWVSPPKCPLLLIVIASRIHVDNPEYVPPLKIFHLITRFGYIK